jgi:glycosyltransferase involved in cell wall biosynthesis
MPVIGADSPGIQAIINHGVNGVLCGTDSQSIRTSIQELLGNPGLCDSLGKNARQYVLEHFSLDRVFEMEYQLYKEILKERESHALN